MATCSRPALPSIQSQCLAVNLRPGRTGVSHQKRRCQAAGEKAQQNGTAVPHIAKVSDETGHLIQEADEEVPAAAAVIVKLRCRFHEADRMCYVQDFEGLLPEEDWVVILPAMHACTDTTKIQPVETHADLFRCGVVQMIL